MTVPIIEGVLGCWLLGWICWTCCQAERDSGALAQLWAYCRARYRSRFIRSYSDRKAGT